MKVKCRRENCSRVAHWFIKRRQGKPEIGGRKILHFCDLCFKRTNASKFFPPSIYLRYYNPQGIELKTFKKPGFKEVFRGVDGDWK